MENLMNFLKLIYQKGFQIKKTNGEAIRVSKTLLSKQQKFQDLYSK